MSDFPPAVIKAAQDAMRKWGVPASVTLAQWSLESDNGKHIPIGSFNPFGIKASGSEPYVTAATHEVVDGRSIATTAKFRKFNSIDEAFGAHGRLLAESNAYREARKNKNDPFAFAKSLTGIYATDPEYGNKLCAIMKRDDLCRYDKGTITMPVIPTPTATLGTKSAMWINLLAGIFSAVDAAGVINVLPPQYGVALSAGSMLINSLLHAMTGNSPVIATPGK